MIGAEGDDLMSNNHEGQTLPPACLDDVLAALRSMLPGLVERHRVRSLSVFGSYVRGTQAPGSDLDLLVEYSETPSLLDVVALETELTQRLGVRVDLVLRSALKPAIGRRILGEAVAA